MTFLQPWALLALPLISLPLIIHLINQRRFQTMNWGAMMFLLSARALSRGYSRLRHWLIMLMRMLAVAAIIMAVGRPLSRGWLALAGGGRPDTAVVILDRSPSMQSRDREAAETKLDTGRRQLAEALATLGASRTLLLTDPERPPLELDDPTAIADLPAAGPVAAHRRTLVAVGAAGQEQGRRQQHGRGAAQERGQTEGSASHRGHRWPVPARERDSTRRPLNQPEPLIQPPLPGRATGGSGTGPADWRSKRTNCVAQPSSIRR